MKILFIDSGHELLRNVLQNMGLICEDFIGQTELDLLNIISTYTGIIVRSKFIIDKKVLDHATNLKFIGRIGAGMDSIDVSYAQAKGIACLNSPEGNRIAVGEHTVGLLLCLLNKIAVSDGEIKQGIRKREANRGVEICGKTIGIIGYGNMGSAFGKCLKGFDAKVIAYDKYKTKFSNEYVEEVSLDTLFEQTDILSIHVPLTDETHYMCNTQFINQFKNNIFLLNTARGKILHTESLVQALKTGKVLGAALDVIEYETHSFETLKIQELPPAYTYLLEANNVVQTPHIAGWTIESKFKMADILAKKIKALLFEK